jgi:hypothetical protein
LRRLRQLRQLEAASEAVDWRHGAKAQSEPVGVDEIMDTVKRALLSLQGRPVSLDDTIQALSQVSFELKQATLKLLSEQQAATMKRRPK